MLILTNAPAVSNGHGGLLSATAARLEPLALPAYGKTTPPHRHSAFWTTAAS